MHLSCFPIQSNQGSCILFSLFSFFFFSSPPVCLLFPSQFLLWFQVVILVWQRSLGKITAWGVFWISGPTQFLNFSVTLSVVTARDRMLKQLGLFTVPAFSPPSNPPGTLLFLLQLYEEENT